MPRKRKAPEQTCPEGTVEAARVKKSDDEPAKLRNIANFIKKSDDSLFGSNIFSSVTLSAVHTELQHSSGGLSVATIFNKRKGGRKPKDSSEDVSEDCVILSQTSLGSPRKAAQRVQYSEQTLEALSKLEALQKEIEAEEPFADDFSDDDVVVCEPEPAEKEIIFRVLGPARLMRFALDPDARLAGPLEEIAKECGVPVTRVLVCDDEGNTVEPGDKPQSLKPGAIYQCIVRRFTGASSEPVPSLPEKSVIAVKFQCASRRKPQLIKIAEEEPLQEGAREFAEIAGLDPSHLVIAFDGERVDPGKTPKELGIEDGDCVDVSVAKS